MRLIDWFKNLKWIRAIRLYAGTVKQVDLLTQRISELESQLQEHAKTVTQEKNFHLQFKEMFATDGLLFCKHANTTTRHATLTNHYGATIDVQIIYCHNCHTVIKDGTTRGIIQLAHQTCDFCEGSGLEKVPHKFGFTMEECRLGKTCPRLRKTIKDKEK